MTISIEYDHLTRFLCAELGFCGSVQNGQPRHVSDYLPSAGEVSAVQFAEWVFLAEGMDLNSAIASAHADKIKKAFVEFMGREVVDAHKFRHPTE